MSEKQVGALAAVAATVVAIIMLLFLHSDVAEAKNYLVRMAGGELVYYPWTNIYGSNYYYPMGRTLKVNDTLEFRYHPGLHNVVGVGRFGYRNCNTTSSHTYPRIGVNKIKLILGMNYFICSVIDPGTGKSCCLDYKMKIAVNTTN